MNWKYYQPKFEYEKKFQDIEWPWAGHKFFAYDLIRNIKPEKVVELGTHKGTSFFSFCQAVKDGKLNTELNAIDTWKGDKHAGFYGNEIFQEVNDIKDSYYNNLDIHLVRKTFDEALNDFTDDSIDILHIDGLHTYEAVKHDFESWIGKVKKSGIILFHDTAEKQADFGVYKLWGKLKEKYKTLEFHHSHGLGILLKGDNKLKDLINFQEIWQNYYLAITENKVFKFKLKDKDYEIDNLNQAVRQKDQQISNLNQAIRQKDQEIERKYQETKNKEDIIQQKDQEINNLNQSIWQKDKEIKFMKSSKFWRLREKYISLKNKMK